MVKLHPAIIITSFLTVVVALAFPLLPVLLLAAVLLTLAYFYCGWHHLKAALTMLKRMRWLLLSIMVIYCWMTPGDTIIESETLSSWLPTFQGVADGTERIVALMMVIASVNLILSLLSREQLLVAIYQLVRPLQLVGISPETVALRITLVIDAVSEVQQLIATRLPAKGTIPFKPAKIGALSASLFSAINDRAEQTPMRDVVLPAIDTPPLIQWFVPLMLLCAFYFVAVTIG